MIFLFLDPTIPGVKGKNKISHIKFLDYKNQISFKYFN